MLDIVPKRLVLMRDHKDRPYVGDRRKLTYSKCLNY
jgi:hypothetical protein